MLSKFTYLLIDILSIAVPFAFSFHPKINFYKTWKAFWPANLIVTVIFIIWDSYFTKIGVWGFNERYLCGINLFNLPLEEILFFICIPYSSLFTYYCFRIFFNHLVFRAKIISIFLSLGLLIIGFVFSTNLYTSVTFISLGIFMIYLTFIEKIKWLKHFLFTYLIILFPFFIVNGILTGSWIQEAIVWYNNQENMGIRILTIPMEDVFYGMLLLMLNTWLYERFSEKKA